MSYRITRRRHDYQVGRELHRRGYGLSQCENAEQIAGWLRAYEFVHGLTATRTYFTAWRQLKAEDLYEDVRVHA